MANYQYSAVNQSGQVVRGKIEARNFADLEKRISRLGLILINGSKSGNGFSPGRQIVSAGGEQG